MKKKNSKLKRGVIVALASIGALLLTGCGVETIKLNDYITVEYEGINTKGEAKLDESAVEEAIESAVYKKAKDNTDRTAAVKKVTEAYHLKIDKEKNLSNGDEITISGEINNELCKAEKIKFVFEEFKVTVEGLKEVPVYTDEDLFKDITLEFSGISPIVKASLMNESGDAQIKNMDYKIEPSSDLKKGDTVVLTMKPKETLDYLIADGATLKKEFVVDGVDAYVSSLDDLTEEHIAAIKSVTDKKLNTYVDTAMRGESFYFGDDYVTYCPAKVENIKLDKIYLLTPLNGNSSMTNHNLLYVTYTYEATFEETEISNYMMAVPQEFAGTTVFQGATAGLCTNDVVIKADGNLDVPGETDFEMAKFNADSEGWYRKTLKDIEQYYDIAERSVE